MNQKRKRKSKAESDFVKKSEWPEVIEDTGGRRVVLQHRIYYTREMFNERIADFAQQLIEIGSADIRDTSEVRRYILEFEIVD
ncbi:MAG: hypothetical protein AB7F88_07180 [Pyrinomonadaceae bacterium]